MKATYETTVRRFRDQATGPGKVWLSNPALSETVVTIGAYYQTPSNLTKIEIEIASTVMNGVWRTAYPNYEHEKIAEDAGGLPVATVEALIAGAPTSFDDTRQQMVYELATTLVAARVVPVSLYRRARALLGDAGVVGVTMLLGWFTGVSLTLAGYDVPFNGSGLEQ